MQKNDIAHKQKLKINGEDVGDLVSITEVVEEEGLIDVPHYGHINQIPDGVVKQQPMECVFLIKRNSRAIEILEDWYNNNKTMDINVISTDAYGVPYHEELLIDCERYKRIRPGYDAAGVTYAQYKFGFVYADKEILRG